MTFEQGFELKEIPPDFNNIKSMNDEELDKFKDSRNFNILMVAAEAGLLEVVNFLIDRGTNVDYEVDGHTAASLAFENRHHSVVLSLLKANSLFPTNFDIEEASDELKNFVELSKNLHSKILDGNEENLTEIFTENPSLRHFYDPQNNSALKIAMIAAMFSIVEILLKFNIFLGPHEEMETIRDELNEDQLKRFRELHLKLSPHIFSDVMMRLMRNCRFGPDCKRHPNYMNFVFNAFQFLLEIPQIAIILEIVAATRDFILVFDFKREFVDYLDPASEPFANGLFYLSGKIYIAAKNMLDPERNREIMSVISHELCHYAMFLTYDNMGKPYRHGDTNRVENFNEISRDCKVHMDSEEIVSMVYDCYPSRFQHAELIVRAPQLLVLYHDCLKLDEIRKFFSKLFKNYEEECVAEMKEALPAIKKKFRPKLEKKVEKLKRWNFLLTGLIILSVFIAIFVGFYFYKPNLSFEKLNNEQKSTLKNSKANFHGVEVKFCDLFANNSKVFDLLTSEVINDALSGDKVKLSKAIKLSYEQFVIFSWKNMTKGLKDKILTSKVNFQGQQIQLNKIANSSALNLLKPPQIRQIFNEIPLNISKQVNVNPDFIVDRFFALESTGISSRFYADDHVNEEIVDVKNAEKIFNDVQNLNIFLLSSIAGEGKSTTFKDFALKFIKKYPWKWIQYVDLKQHFDAFEKFKESEKISQFLSQKLLKLNDFEGEIFKNLFETNNVTFFWDGVDEISPTFNDVILDIISSIQKVSKNFQFISTRPQHSARIQNKFQISAHKLIPLGKVEQWDLMRKLITSKYSECAESMETTECSKIIEKSKEILKSFENSNDGFKLLNPLLIKIIADIAGNEKIEPGENLNFYSVFEIFIKRKLNITQEKGEVVLGDLLNVNTKSSVNIMQVHQAFALKLVFEDFFKFISNENLLKVEDLDIMKSIPKLTIDEISRYGIIQVFTSHDFEFNHRTFAEFLVAQFFIDNMEDFDVSKNDTKLRLVLFNEALYNAKFRVVQILLRDFIKTHEKLSKVLNLLKDQNLKSSEIVSSVKNQEIVKFYFYMEYLHFFETNQKIDIEMLPYINKRWWSYITYEALLNNSESIKRIFGMEILRFSLTRNSTDGTLLHEAVLRNNSETFFTILMENLNSNEISSFLLRRNRSNNTAFNFAAKESTEEKLKLFWSFVERFLSFDERKNLLITQNVFNSTALEMSATNYDPNSFKFIKEIYESFFTKVEIKNIFTHSNGSFITDTVGVASYETTSSVSDYLEHLFESEKLQLRNILSFVDEDRDTIFTYYKNEPFTKNKLEVFVQLLRKTFDNEEEFQVYYDSLSTSLRLLLKPSSSSEKSIVRNFEWKILDFQFLINFWDKINANLHVEGFHSLLTGKNSLNQSILHGFFNLPDTNNLTNQFLMKLNSTLNKTEIISLLETTKLNQTPLMVSAIKSNEEDLTSLWSFIEESFDIVERKKFLIEKGTNFNTFDFATLNKNPKSFLKIKQIYEKYFTPEELRGISLKYFNSSFIFKSIESASFETITEISKYFEEIFINDKFKLREMLGNRYKNDETIFSRFVYDEEVKKKSEIFIQLLRKTFVENEEEEFIKFFEYLPISWR